MARDARGKPAHDEERRMTSRRLLLLGPGLAWLTALLILPCALIFVLGFFERGV